MQKDLFQISQMNDIYYTLNLWSVLSPNMRGDKKESVIEVSRHRKPSGKVASNKTGPKKGR